MKRQSALTERQAKAIEAIAAKGGTSFKRLAQAGGVAPDTLKRWLQQPVFEEAFKAAIEAAHGKKSAEFIEANNQILAQGCNRLSLKKDFSGFPDTTRSK